MFISLGKKMIAILRTKILLNLAFGPPAHHRHYVEEVNYFCDCFLTVANTEPGGSMVLCFMSFKLTVV